MMMPISEKEIKALQAEIQRLSSKHKIPFRHAFNTLLELISSSSGVSSAELLYNYLAQIKAGEGVVKVTARDTTISQIVEIFDLTRTKKARWTLAEDHILEAPKILCISGCYLVFNDHTLIELVLVRNLADLDEAFYEEQSEASCRIAIDLILIQCRKYIRQKYFPAKAETPFLTAPSTSSKNAFDLPAATPRKPVKLYPESTISVEIPDRSAPNKKFLVTGRADWAFGYSPKDEDGALLAALEAKQRSEFSSGESQLIAYLAILRENHRKAGRTNSITQGFYSDGTRFTFIYIDNDGSIINSPTWDIEANGGLNMVFSFIVAMLENALKSTPTATPTKPGKQQDKEIQGFDNEVWPKIFNRVEKSLRISDDSDDDSDDDMDNTIEFSESISRKHTM